MKNLIKREGLNLVLVALPFIYLASIYGGLPGEVPLHWNLSGEIDRMGSKSELWLIPFVLPTLTYIILLAVPIIDPKKKIEKMGGKFQSLKTMVVLFLSALAVYIIHTSAHPETMSLSIVVIFLGLMFMGLGNFFKTIQPNYFLGVRTPWTLESEEVWKSTHQLAGILWLLGGLVMILLGLFIKDLPVFILAIGIGFIVSLVPYGYSWYAYRKLD